MLTVVLAGLLAVLGAIAVLAYARQANARAVDGLKPVTVFEATNPIPGGTSLGAAFKAKDLTPVTVPASSLSAVPVRSVTAKNENLVLSGLLGKGQLLLEPMLVTAGKRVASVVTIPAGKVAVTVALCIPEAVAGYVTAGSRVAVFDTYVSLAQSKAVSLQRTCEVGHQAAPTGVVHTQLVQSNLEVLSVGVPSVSGQSLSGAISQVQALSENSSVTSQGAVLVTFAVDPAVAAKLIQAAEVGLPYLALIPPNATPNFGASVSLFG
jgi:pilus assembly protein CpaB